MKTVTIRQITLRGEPPYDWRKAAGVCLGLGVEVERTPGGLLVSEADVERVVAVLERDRHEMASAS